MSHIYGCLALTEEQQEFRLLRPDTNTEERATLQLRNSVDEFVLSGVFLGTLGRWYAVPQGKLPNRPYFSYLDSDEISALANVDKRSIYKPLNRLKDLDLVVTKYSEEERPRGSAQMWSLTQIGLYLRVQSLLDLGATAVKAKKVLRKID